MLSVVIHFALDYLAFTMGMITSTPEVCPSESFLTKEMSSQCSNAYTGYGLNCFTMFCTKLMYHFNGRTAQPLEHTTAPGGKKLTSMCQTFPSIYALGENHP
ncbi:hypothetical protein ACH5RR_023119 [Cinchona calisaya]|uniref:Uncharacterized protein n=1 Tax=Cinchona calisaya TaxID=153742 RepID=A0ABD2ZCX8_9GENT